MSPAAFPSELLGGYVLAGGASSRMGQDKALLPFEGITWVEHAVSTLREVCAEVAVLSGSGKGAERTSTLGRVARLVPDRQAFGGPAAGICSALADTRRRWALIVAVDQPYLPASLLCRWFESVTIAGCAASCMQLGDRLQPVPLLIESRLADGVQTCVHRGERKVLTVVESALLDTASPPLHRFHVAENAQTTAWFRNLNYPEDLISG